MTDKLPEEVLSALKAGARHNQEDLKALQDIHDAVISLGASCPEPKSEIVTFPPLGGYDKSLYFGGAVKALGGGKVGGFLVRYGDSETLDLTQQFFTKDTDYGDAKELPVYYQHGQDIHFGKRRISRATISNDEFGKWAEAQLDMRDEYERFLYNMAESGKMGWSSGTASHLVEFEPIGKAEWIKTWPLVEASLTPTPAEPRNNVISLKSFVTNLQAAPIEPTEAAGDAAPVDGEAQPKPTELLSKDNKMELTQEQLEEIVAQAGRSGADAAIKSLPTVNAAGVQVTLDEADRPFQNFGAQLSAVKQATLTQGRELAPRLKALNIKALGANELVGSEGGFLLEPSFAANLLTPVHDTGPFSSRAAKLPIGPNANGVTVRAVDETNRAAGSRWGGILGYRLAEGGTKVASTPTFRLAELRLKKYAVLCYATEELLQDTTALAGIVQQGASEELDFMVNDDILNGAGAAGPLGILNSPALVSVSKESGQIAATLLIENVYKMWARMHPRSKGNSVWFINTDVTPQLFGLNQAVGTGGFPMFMAPGSLPNSPSGSLLGRPIVETEFNATLGTVGDIVLADMSQYIMIDRDVQAASSIHVQFLTDQVAYRFVYRADGQPKIAAPLTPYKGTSNTLSPFVALATRA